MRWRFVIIFVVGVVFALGEAHGYERDWVFFLHGNELLFGQHRLPALDSPGGLHIYANYPVLQIGPLSLLAVTPFRLFGAEALQVLQAALTAAGFVLIVYLERVAKRWRGTSEDAIDFIEFTILIGGTAVMAAWSAVAVDWAHIDDVLVLAFACVAVSAIARRSAWALGAAIGLGIAAKPWGMIMLPLILVLPWRSWSKAVVTAGSIAAVWWLPFLIADPGTFEALKPAVRMEPDSLVHLVGFSDAPPWIRPVQFTATLAVGLLAVRRGRWSSVLLVGISTRLLLDPGTFTYYSSGLVLAALVWDLLRSSTALPVWTMVTFWLLPILGIDQLTTTGRGIARVLITLGVVVFVLGPRRRPEEASI